MSRAAAVFLRNPVSKEETLLGTFESEGTIGKSPTARVFLDNLRADELHALIEEDKGGDGFLLLDLGSQAGTFYKGKRIDETRIKYGDIFMVGNQQLVIRDFQSAANVLTQSVIAKATGQAGLLDASVTRERSVTRSPTPASEGDLLQVSLYWGETLLEMRTFTPGGIITLGAQKEATFPVTLKDPKFQKYPFPVAKYRRKGLQLNIPSEATGLVWHGNETYSLDFLRHKDQSNVDFSDLTLEISHKDRADISFGELTLSFRFIAPAQKIPMNLIGSLDQTFIKIGSALLAFYALIFFWISTAVVDKPPDKTLDDLPRELKRSLFNAGLAKAAQRRQSAIGQLARDNQGGRAKGEEGKATAQKSPVVAHPEKKKETPKPVKQPAKVAAQAAKHRELENLNRKAPIKGGKSIATTGEKPVKVDIDSAFTSAPEKTLTVPDTAGGPAGKTQSGNTIAAFADSGSFARGRKGQGGGGGGESVGIGTLKGNTTGGGEGGGDFGVLKSKGHEIRVPQTEEIMILGGLDRDVIAAIVKRYLPQIQHCYEQQLVTNPKLKGKVTMAWTITGSGSVEKAEVAESSLGNDSAEKCMAQKILGWKFPKPRGGGTVGVKYPFLLMSSVAVRGEE